MPKPAHRAVEGVRRLCNVLIFTVALFLIYFLSIFGPVSAQARAQTKAPQPLKQDENCLACHGQAGMTSGSGKSISVDPVKHAASVHGHRPLVSTQSQFHCPPQPTVAFKPTGCVDR